MVVKTLDRCAGNESEDSSQYLAAFIVSVILQSIGSVPLFVLGVSYLDDASPPVTSSLHIGKQLSQLDNGKIWFCNVAVLHEIFELNRPNNVKVQVSV